MFPFAPTPAKIVDVVAGFLRHGPLSRSKVLSLVYIAERESLAERGCPILGGEIRDSKSGPFNADVLAMMVCKIDPWTPHIATNDKTLSLIVKPEWLELSEYDREKIDDVFRRYGESEPPAFPESKLGYGRIPMEAILMQVGMSQAEAEYLVGEHESHETLSMLLALH